MKDYIFYPLSLSGPFANLGRKTKKVFGQFIGKRLPAFLAMFIVYFLVGFWHGANWTYIMYGIYNGIFIAAGILLDEFYSASRKKLGINDVSITWRLFQIFRTFILVSCGRYFSNAATLTDAFGMFKYTGIRIWDMSFIVDGTLEKMGLDTANWIVLIIFILIFIWTDFLHEKGYHIRDSLGRQHIIFRWIILLTAVFSVAILGIYGPEYNAVDFIYGRF